MSAIAQPSLGADRPRTLIAAVTLATVGGVASIATLPMTPDEAPGAVVWISLAAGLVFLAGGWGIWLRSHLAARVVFVVSLVNGLAAAPGVFVADEVWVQGFAAVAVAHAIALCWLLLARTTRAALR